jgi:hypothetical protein
MPPNVGICTAANDAAVAPGLPSWKRRRLLGRRKFRAEGSFADAANRHGYKRARWRGLTWMTVRNLLIATIQNVRKLPRGLPKSPKAGLGALAHARKSLHAAAIALLEITRRYCLRQETDKPVWMP